jgi:hypothetical protein
MLDMKKDTPFDKLRTPLHTHPSLLPLRAALTTAERESPSCPQTPPTVDEQLASKFIEKVRKVHRRSNLFADMKELAG